VHGRKMAFMETTVSLDKAGRIVLPKKVRDELRLLPGESLDLVSDGSQITLRPTQGASRMRKIHGVWVFSSGAPIAAAETDRVLEEVRRGRRGQ
jgi:AbrB family looped-hinge helix DNA binding protein